MAKKTKRRAPSRGDNLRKAMEVVVLGYGVPREDLNNLVLASIRAFRQGVGISYDTYELMLDEVMELDFYSDERNEL